MAVRKNFVGLICYIAVSLNLFELQVGSLELGQNISFIDL